MRFQARGRTRNCARQRNDITTVPQHAQQRDHVPYLGTVVESVAADDDVRQRMRGERDRNRSGDRVGAAEHSDAGGSDSRGDEPCRLECDRVGFRGAIGARPQFHLLAALR